MAQNAITRIEGERQAFLTENNLIDGHIDESISNNVFEVPKLIQETTKNIRNSNVETYINHYYKIDNHINGGSSEGEKNRNKKVHLEYLMKNGDTSLQFYKENQKADPNVDFDYEKYLNGRGFYRIEISQGTNTEESKDWGIEQLGDEADNLDKWMIVEETGDNQTKKDTQSIDYRFPSLVMSAEFRDGLNSELEEVDSYKTSCHTSSRNSWPRRAPPT